MLAKTTTGVTVTVGDVLDALVLDVDSNSQILEGTIDQTIIQSMGVVATAAGKGEGNKGNKKKKGKESVIDSNSTVSLLKSLENISPGELFHSATILLVKEKYLVVVIAPPQSNQPSVVCYVMIADYHCPYKDTSAYSIGQQIPIRIERVLRSPIPSNDIITPYDQVTIASLFDEVSDQHRTKSALVQKEIETSDAKIQEKLQTESSSNLLRVGQTLKWIVESIDSLQIHVRPENMTEFPLDIASLSASIHLSSVIDHADGCDDLETSLEKFASLKKKQKQLPITPSHPFYEIKQGQVLSAKVIHLWRKKQEGDNKDDAKFTTVVTLTAQLQQSGKLTSLFYLPSLLSDSALLSLLLLPSVGSGLCD
jgi:hypothetical protein